MAPSIILFGKADDFFCEQAVDFIKQHFSNTNIYLGKRGKPFPEAALKWKGDLLISYLSPWIIPGRLLDVSAMANINFHPGPSEYPGIGCTNFAIYNDAASFGITCHHMRKKVDTGKIIVEKRFHVYESDTVFSLTRRCYSHILTVFYDVMSMVLDGKKLPETDIEWKRAAYTRKELNALCRLTLDMGEEEISRRIKAVTFPNAPGAYFEINGQIHKIGW